MWKLTEAVYKRSEITGSAKTVYLYLAHRADDETGRCWPAQTTIADETGISRRTVIRAIRDLVDMGEIEVLEQGGGRGIHTVYYLKGCHGVTVSAPKKGDTVTQKGDIDDIKGDTVSQKGDTMSHRIYKKIQEDAEEVYINGREPIIGGFAPEVIDPEPEERRPTAPESVLEMAAAIAASAREPYGFGVNEERYHDLAYTFIGYDYEPEEVRGFGDWWKAKQGEKGFYLGRPALTSVQNRMSVYIDELRNGRLEATSEYQEITYDKL